MKIKSSILDSFPCMKRESYCSDCFANLDWETHNAGDIDMECWIAYCDCNNHQRMWTMRAHSFKFSSICDGK